MSSEGGFAFSRVNFPQPDLAIATPDGDRISIGGVCNGSNTTRVPYKRSFEFACVNIQQVCLLVEMSPAGRESFSVRRKR